MIHEYLTNHLLVHFFVYNKHIKGIGVSGGCQIEKFLGKAGKFYYFLGAIFCLFFSHSVSVPPAIGKLWR